MVLNEMKKILLYIFIIFFTVFFSCDETAFLVNCHDCYPDEPESATLVLKLDKNFSGGLQPAAVVRIYLGNIEDKTVLNTFYVSHRNWEIDVALNRKYTITATYTDNHGTKYTAVDTAYPRVKYEKNQCENPCYYVYDRFVNLTIKYR